MCKLTKKSAFRRVPYSHFSPYAFPGAQANIGMRWPSLIAASRSTLLPPPATRCTTMNRPQISPIYTDKKAQGRHSNGSVSTTEIGEHHHGMVIKRECVQKRTALHRPSKSTPSAHEEHFIGHRTALSLHPHATAFTVRHLPYGHRSALHRPSKQASSTVRHMPYGHATTQPSPPHATPLPLEVHSIGPIPRFTLTFNPDVHTQQAPPQAYEGRETGLAMWLRHTLLHKS